MIQHLIRSDLSDVLLDAESAARFSVGSSSVDSLVRVALPPQLAGPIEPVSAETVFELRPRLGAGLHVALAMHDDRFRELMEPGHAPDIVSCLTAAGPVRLQRDLKVEKTVADGLVEQFELNELSSDGAYRWVVESDERALDLLASLYSGGESTPRLIPPGEGFLARGFEVVRRGVHRRVQYLRHTSSVSVWAMWVTIRT